MSFCLHFCLMVFQTPLFLSLCQLPNYSFPNSLVSLTFAPEAPVFPPHRNVDAFTPQQTTELVCRIEAKTATTSLENFLISSCMVSPLLGLGCAVALSIKAAPWFQEMLRALRAPSGRRTFPSASS